MAHTKCLAMAYEMVGTGPNGRKDTLGRVSVVNELGEVLLEELVLPSKKITDYRTAVTGISAYDLEVEGMDYCDVRDSVCEIIYKRTLVGHGISFNLKLLGLCHPPWMIRDTCLFTPFIWNKFDHIPTLTELSSTLLKMQIRNGVNRTTDKAYASMRLYKSVAKQWDACLDGKVHD